MEIVENPFDGCYLLKDNIFRDSRGYFFESFNHRRLQELTGWEGSFVQDNQSASSYGVVRGLHFQESPHAQTKLVRVLKGCVLDIIVDIRPDSPHFGKHFSVELSEQNNLQLLIPRGMAHGFSVLSDEAVFFYKCDAYYHKPSEGGIYPLDADLNLDWKVPADRMVLSEKDISASRWQAYRRQVLMGA